MNAEAFWILEKVKSFKAVKDCWLRLVLYGRGSQTAAYGQFVAHQLSESGLQGFSIQYDDQLILML